MTNFNELTPDEAFRSQDRKLDLDQSRLLATIPSSSIAMTNLRRALHQFSSSDDASEQAKRLVASVLNAEKPLSALLNEAVFPLPASEEVEADMQNSPKSRGIRWV